MLVCGGCCCWYWCDWLIATVEFCVPALGSIGFEWETELWLAAAWILLVLLIVFCWDEFACVAEIKDVDSDIWFNAT